MRLVVGAEDAAGLRVAIGRPHVANLERCHDDALEIPQRDLVAGREPLCKGLGDIERYRDRPEQAVGKTHRRDDRVVVVPVEEALERREGAVQQQLDVAKLALGQVP